MAVRARPVAAARTEVFGKIEIAIGIRKGS
jgi:hypothetical protein